MYRSFPFIVSANILTILEASAQELSHDIQERIRESVARGIYGMERASSQKKEEKNPKVYSGEQVGAYIDVKRYTLSTWRELLAT